jgi:hypothetical protein
VRLTASVTATMVVSHRVVAPPLVSAGLIGRGGMALELPGDAVASMTLGCPPVAA